MTYPKAAILNCSVFEWWFENQTILNPNSKMFGFRMDSEFECSVFEPPLYSHVQFSNGSPIIRPPFEYHTKFSAVFKWHWIT